MTERGYPVDRATQAWVRATGRRIELGEHPWLEGPIGDPRLIADQWLGREARRVGGMIREGGGLLPAMAELSGEGFDPAQLAQAVRDFYERTPEWRLEAWSQWSLVAWPFGWLLSSVFARRLEQLSLPLRPLDVSRGMNSHVLSVVDADGAQVGAAWVRTLRSTGQTIYSGWYGTALLPGAQRLSVRVVFPLPHGSLTVLLRPENGDGGALRLVSPGGRFGDNGAYLLVAGKQSRTAWVRRIPIFEEFTVYLDGGKVLRTDHALDLWSIPVIKLHYRIERRLDATRSWDSPDEMN